MDQQAKINESLNSEQEYIRNIQVSLYENFNILLENQKNKVENQDIVVQNQSLIIRNQDVIVNNQINIIKNQKQIVENQVTLSAILKTQAKLLYLMENLSGNKKSQADVNHSVSEIFAECKEQFESGILDMSNLNG